MAGSWTTILLLALGQQYSGWLYDSNTVAVCMAEAQWQAIGQQHSQRLYDSNALAGCITAMQWQTV